MVERILQLAKEKGVKQSYLEEKIGGYRGKITDWKNKKSSPNTNDLKIIALILDTTEAYLRGETDDPSIHPQTSASSSRLSGEEQDLLILYRSLSPEKRDQVFRLLKAL